MNKKFKEYFEKYIIVEQLNTVPFFDKQSASALITIFNNLIAYEYYE